MDAGLVTLEQRSVRVADSSGHDDWAMGEVSKDSHPSGLEIYEVDHRPGLAVCLSPTPTPFFVLVDF